MSDQTSRPPIFALARGVGHTRALIEGAKHTKGVVIVAYSQKYADELARRCDDASGIGLDSLDRLRGRVAPVLFDHHAIESLVIDMGSLWETLVKTRRELADKQAELEAAKAREEALVERVTFEVARRTADAPPNDYTLACYMLRDTKIAEREGMTDLLWALHNSSYASKADWEPVRDAWDAQYRKEMLAASEPPGEEGT